MRRLGIGMSLMGGLMATPARGDDPPPVSLADLAGYRAALAARPDPAVTSAVTFRDLWDHPEIHRGHPVRVEGRLARLFRQPAVGQFPPLAEAWITSPGGEPTCLVFPTGPGPAAPGPGPGDQVRFVGTFLRQITYPGGDAKRVAPLIVGGTSPAVVAAGSRAGTTPFGPIFGGDHLGDWGIGLAASLGVLWVLLRRHLGRPSELPTPIDPPPAFLDGGSADPDGPGGDRDDDQ